MEHWQAVGLDVWSVVKYLGPFGGALITIEATRSDNDDFGYALFGVIIYMYSLWSIAK